LIFLSTLVEGKFVYTGILSKNLDPKATRHWADEGLLKVHEPLRADLERLTDALRPEFFDGTVSWKVDDFFAWFDSFSSIVHHHHDSEENFIFPAIASKGHLDSKLLADHKALLTVLEDIPKLKALFDNAKNDAEKKSAAAKLRGQAAALKKLLIDHLDYEELVTVKELKAHFTLDDWSVVEEAIKNSVSIRDGRYTIASFVFHMRVWGGQDELDRLFAKIPAPAKLIISYILTSEYAFDHIGKIDSISSHKQRPSLKDLAIKALVAFLVIYFTRKFLGLKGFLKFAFFLVASLVVLKLTSQFLPVIIADVFLIVAPLVEGTVDDFLLLLGE